MLSVVMGLSVAVLGACTAETEVDVGAAPISQAPIGPGGTPTTDDPGSGSGTRAVELDGDAITHDWTN